MVQRKQVEELRSRSRLTPTASRVNTYFRPELDDRKSRELSQLADALDKMAPVAQDMAEAQYKQRERKVEAERTLDNRKKFTDWTNSLDQSIYQLENDKFGPALDGKFAEFMKGVTDPNDQFMMTELYGDFYVRQSNNVGKKNAEAERTRQLDKLGTMLWSTVTDESKSVEERVAAIEGVIDFGHNEFGYSRDILNDWLVEKQLEIAGYEDARENYVILEWMKQTDRMGVQKYQKALDTILHEQKTKTGIALEVERKRVINEHRELMEKGQLNDAWYDSLIENGTFTATQVEALKTDADKFYKEVESGRIRDDIVDGVVTSIVGGNNSAALPNEVFQDTAFVDAVEAGAAELGVPAGWLYAIMSFETGGTFDPAEINKAGSGATGLIQFMPETAKGLGTTVEDLAKMSRAEQIKYVVEYYKPYAKYINSPDDFYLATIYPAALVQGYGDNYQFGAKGMPIYDQNPIFDMNNDGIITIGEVRQKFLSNGHASRYTAFNGQSSGTLSIPDEGITLPNGKTFTKAEIESQVIADYAAKSAATAAALGETPEQTIIRELNDFWGAAGKQLVNPRWAKLLETGFNLASGKMGDGSIPPDQAKMAMTLYTQMAARAPHLLSKYMDNEQQAFYEAASFFRDDMKQEPQAALITARMNLERNSSPQAAEDRKKMVDDVVEDYLDNEDGWFFKTFGNSDVYNQPEVGTRIKELFDNALKFGMNSEQAKKFVERRLANDYAQVGESVVDVSHKDIQIYGVEKLQSDMGSVITLLTELDADYVEYFKTQGEGADNLQIMQDSRFKTRFFFVDGNGNPVPPIMEGPDGKPVISGGYLFVDLNMLPALVKESRTAEILATQEEKDKEEKAATETRAPDGSVVDQDQQKADIMAAYQDGVLSQEELKDLQKKYGFQWNYDGQGRQIVNPAMIGGDD